MLVHLLRASRRSSQLKQRSRTRLIATGIIVHGRRPARFCWKLCPLVIQRVRYVSLGVVVCVLTVGAVFRRHL